VVRTAAALPVFQAMHQFRDAGRKSAVEFRERRGGHGRRFRFDDRVTGAVNTIAAARRAP
jgi:hypothetical protein